MKTILLLISVLSLSIAFAQEEIDSTEIFTIVEQMPVFSKECSDLKSQEEQEKCTMKEIMMYSYQVEYPQEAYNEKIEGKVYVSFVVDKDGTVIDVVLLTGVNELLDEAALQHVKKMPAFYLPAYQKGKEVQVKYNIPIIFKMDMPTFKKKKKKRNR